jgi:hyperosmotically inducible periplasmic protein
LLDSLGLGVRLALPVAMRRFSRPLTLSLAAAVVGAGLVWFLDPSSGRRRRHVARDKGLSLARRGVHRGRRTVRHASSDAVGLGKRLAHNLPGNEPELDDATLAHKVESIVFRDHDVPKGQININAERGVVFLRGQVNRPELVEVLEERARKVKGVRDVRNLLHLPTQSPPQPRDY